MPVVIVELLGAPQGKGRPRFRVVKPKRGGEFVNTYTPSATRKYEEQLRAEAVRRMGARPPLSGALAVVVHAYMPIPESWPRRKRQAALDGLVYPATKPDWENIAKTLDAFNGVVWEDDRQIVDGRVIKVYSDKPALFVEVRTVESALTVVTGAREMVGAV